MNPGRPRSVPESRQGPDAYWPRRRLRRPRVHPVHRGNSNSSTARPGSMGCIAMQCFRRRVKDRIRTFSGRRRFSSRCHGTFPPASNHPGFRHRRDSLRPTKRTHRANSPPFSDRVRRQRCGDRGRQPPVPCQFADGRQAAGPNDNDRGDPACAVPIERVGAFARRRLGHRRGVPWPLDAGPPIGRHPHRRSGCHLRRVSAD
jgi:hypothetical protein